MSSNINFVYLIDEKDKTCIGYKNGQVNIKHVGRIEIDADSNIIFLTIR